MPGADQPHASLRSGGKPEDEAAAISNLEWQHLDAGKVVHESKTTDAT